ncbi:hypothetical protein [Streptomyces roseolilacinus]|uniref:hypothetical protein n=1 Tax=Streptomyces roseolilacinus TaxID=66904 RepID=UPI001672C107|nr:hypothetical protein [Streptomyces roseolilacinus]
MIRARRRLFVVGDHDAWQRHAYVDVPATRLPRLPEDEHDAVRALTPPALPGGRRCR